MYKFLRGCKLLVTLNKYPGSYGKGDLFCAKLLHGLPFLSVMNQSFCCFTIFIITWYCQFSEFSSFNMCIELSYFCFNLCFLKKWFRMSSHAYLTSVSLKRCLLIRPLPFFPNKMIINTL